MKSFIIKLSITVIILSCAPGIQSQDLVKLISVEICNCVDTIENMDSLEAKLDRCFPESFETVFSLLDDNMQEMIDDAKLDEIVEGVYGNLLYYCPKIKKYILSVKEKEYYRMSDSDIANKFYEEGNKAGEANDYKTAIKLYNKAIKADKKWVLPLDNLGLIYRSMGRYNDAVKYYERSLKIYPEGRYALQDQAVAYTFLNNFLKALDNYDRLINLYPDYPEGYFGIARVLYIIKDYEKALDYAFHSHNMYVEQNSGYSKDSEKLLTMIYQSLKEEKRDSLFFDKAKQYGVNIIQNQDNRP